MVKFEIKNIMNEIVNYLQKSYILKNCTISNRNNMTIIHCEYEDFKTDIPVDPNTTLQNFKDIINDRYKRFLMIELDILKGDVVLLEKIVESYEKLI